MTYPVYVYGTRNGSFLINGKMRSVEHKLPMQEVRLGAALLAITEAAAGLEDVKVTSVGVDQEGGHILVEGWRELTEDEAKGAARNLIRRFTEEYKSVLGESMGQVWKDAAAGLLAEFDLAPGLITGLKAIAE